MAYKKQKGGPKMYRKDGDAPVKNIKNMKAYSKPGDAVQFGDAPTDMNYGPMDMGYGKSPIRDQMKMPNDPTMTEDMRKGMEKTIKRHNSNLSNTEQHAKTKHSPVEMKSPVKDKKGDNPMGEHNRTHHPMPDLRKGKSPTEMKSPVKTGTMGDGHKMTADNATGNYLHNRRKHGFDEEGNPPKKKAPTEMKSSGFKMKSGSPFQRNFDIGTSPVKAAKPDYPDIDGDGDTTESMKKAAADKKSPLPKIESYKTSFVDDDTEAEDTEGNVAFEEGTDSDIVGESQKSRVKPTGEQEQSVIEERSKRWDGLSTEMKRKYGFNKDNWMMGDKTGGTSDDIKEGADLSVERTTNKEGVVTPDSFYEVNKDFQEALKGGMVTDENWKKSFSGKDGLAAANIALEAEDITPEKHAELTSMYNEQLDRQSTGQADVENEKANAMIAQYMADNPDVTDKQDAVNALADKLPTGISGGNIDIDVPGDPTERSKRENAIYTRLKDKNPNLSEKELRERSSKAMETEDTRIASYL